MADCRVASDAGQILATFALGSCIGLSVYDSKAGVGGLLHYMLPDSSIDPARGRENPFMFADTGIPMLIEQVCARGANKRQLVAHAAGGASIMDPNNVFDIGKRNHQALRKILWKAGILISGEEVGGDQSRTIRLEIGSGRLWLQTGSGQKELVPGFPRPAAPAPPAGGTAPQWTPGSWRPGVVGVAQRSAERNGQQTRSAFPEKGGANGLPGLNRG
jgi:chemotaxis protein CheD